MKWSVRILITAVLSVTAAVSLSILPQLDKFAGADTLDVWSGKHARQLTNSNLIDLLVQTPLQLRIRKVELINNRLTLDLSMPKNAEPSVVYRDLYTIAQMVTFKTKNVDQVWVRVLDYSGVSDKTPAQLILAMVADREHGKDMEANVDELSPIQMEQQLQNRFRMTYTSKWRQKYPL